MMAISGIIDSIEKFDKIIKDIQLRRLQTQIRGLPLRQEFYRGQLGRNWHIIPSLTRRLQSAEQVERAEDHLINLFRDEINSNNYQHKICLPTNPFHHVEDWYWLFQAQHYGIPTRLLDWTLKAEVGLWFAVNDRSFDDIDGQFFVFYFPSWKTKIDGSDLERDYCTTPLSKVNEIWMMNPAFHNNENYTDTVAERRRARQFGKFIIQPYGESLIGLDQQSDLLNDWQNTMYDGKPVIEKYIVPAHYKSQIRLDLTTRGQFDDFLYVEHDPIIESIKEKCCAALAGFL